MRALGRPQDTFSDKAIQLQPIFAQWIQSLHTLAPGSTAPNALATSSYAFGGDIIAVNGKVAMMPISLGTADFMVHHIHAFTIHVTVLILLKGTLFARSSRLIPDKVNLGFRFPCDGPGRGGTCDISAWDAFYLSMFWMLNTIAWVTFYWHWKHMTIWGGNPAQFNESSNYIMGWLRDYLWLSSSPLINGYNPFGMNSQAVWAWMFLFGHLIWATGFMFLISWRGYWQELIETLVWAHERTPLANLVRWRDKPVALSIVQARLVGLAHFAVGYILTYAAFVIASTSGKFG
jgi:photosystem I P700 chlorophyll a apoprotein A2